MRFFSRPFQHVIAAVLVCAFAINAPANPTGMSVQSGSATATVNGSQLTIAASQNAFLNWQSFNIAAGETTIFQQPSSTSIVWNQINNQSASQIYGSLQANGIVVLLNSSGFYFGPNSFVSAAGLVVSTANCLPPQNSGGSWEFNGPPPLASIVNYGQIKVGNGGSAFLIADNVQNYGDIEAPGGGVGLAAGQTVLLSDRPDGRGMSMQVTLPSGSVDNEGRLVADAGTIAMNAQVVNQNGFIQANSVQDVNGTIELVAADQLNLGASSQIIANGDDSAGGSSGGSVTLQSGNTFSDSAGSQVNVTGGANGGNGGSVEISAPNILSLNSGVDAGAQSGWDSGVFTLDPQNIVLGTSGSTSGGASGTINGTTGSSTLNVNVNTAFQNINAGQIFLEASGDISLTAGTAWDLYSSTGGKTSGLLTLEAGGNITLNAGSSITDANSWNIALYAGVNSFSVSTPTVKPGIGSILLNGGSDQGQTVPGSLIQTAEGNINLTAGEDILVNADQEDNSGYIITTGGGSIYAHALAGSIDTGSYAQGYLFNTSRSSVGAAYTLNDGLGGISTEAGGSVTLIAGGNVTSVLPGKKGFYFDGNFLSPLNSAGTYTTAGSGAYGSQPGNVTIVAGGDVTGNYLVANGVGSIFAGVQMDANGNPVTDSSGNYVMGATGNAGTPGTSGLPLALNLISGGWNVTAAQDITLQEVRNPNGIFDISGGAAYTHNFDYASDDYVNLTAGNLVQLGASTSTLPRLDNVPVIYPPILNISAGAGGVILGTLTSATSLILFPSPQGSLTINTTDGGSLVSGLNPAKGSLFSLIVSDSSSKQYTSSTSFGASDHAATPIHEDSSTPIDLNISGNMSLIYLVVPEAAQINVGGDMVNCGFQGMNVAANDAVTSITVAGDIINRSAFTSIDLPSGDQPPDLSLLSEAIPGPNDPSAVQLITSFYYNKTTQTLTYQNITGATLLSVLTLLNNLTVQEYINGVPQWADPPYDTIPIVSPNTVSVLGDPTTPGTIAYALLAQYNALGAIPTTPTGYAIGGGGQFNITARTIDLGTSGGIQSDGVALYTVLGSYPLANLFGAGGVFDHGADITVTTTGNPSAGENAYGDVIGDLDMYSSSIASLQGGNIYINASGDVNAGSSVFTVNTFGATGIYSTDQGNVDVYANDDINVNGSRIAVYDTRQSSDNSSVTPGGSVTVVSKNGGIDAGNGGSGLVNVSSFEVGADHSVAAFSSTIPGSGIMDISYTDDGNVLVEAPNGTINAGAGGILQLLLNGPPLPESTTLFGQPFDFNGLAKMFNLALTGKFKNALELQNTFNGNPGNNAVDVFAGYELEKLDGSGNPIVDAYGNPVVTALDLSDGTLVKTSDSQDITATGSGVLGTGTITLDASGDITGNIFTLGNVNVNAVNNINVSVFGLGDVSVGSASGTISGTIIGVGSVSASGGSIDANLESNGSVTGNTSGQSGFAQGTAANAASQGMASDNSSNPAKTTDTGDDDEKKKKRKEVALAEKTGRVTVILPPRKQNQPKS